MLRYDLYARFLTYFKYTKDVSLWETPFVDKSPYYWIGNSNLRVTEFFLIEFNTAYKIILCSFFSLEPFYFNFLILNLFIG